MKTLFSDLNYLRKNLKDDEWIGVDLDGTLAYDDDNKEFDENFIGEPIEKMIDVVKFWLSEGYNVKIFTARVTDDGTKDLTKIKTLIQQYLYRLRKFQMFLN